MTLQLSTAHIHYSPKMRSLNKLYLPFPHEMVLVNPVIFTATPHPVRDNSLFRSPNIRRETFMNIPRPGKIVLNYPSLSHSGGLLGPADTNYVGRMSSQIPAEAIGLMSEKYLVALEEDVKK